jgi:hypothetical protein
MDEVQEVLTQKKEALESILEEKKEEAEKIVDEEVSKAIEKIGEESSEIISSIPGATKVVEIVDAALTNVSCSCFLFGWKISAKKVAPLRSTKLVLSSEPPK